MNETIQCISQRNHLFIPAIYICFLSILFLMPRCCTYHTRLFIVTKLRILLLLAVIPVIYVSQYLGVQALGGAMGGMVIAWGT